MARDGRKSFDAWVAEGLRRKHLSEPSDGALRQAIALGSQLPRRRPLPRPALSLATAATVVLAVVGAYLLLPERPRDAKEGMLPAGPMRTVGLPVPLQPTGLLREAPRQFRWALTSGESPCRVRLMRVDGLILWEITVESNSALLPGDFVDDLRAGSRYEWSVRCGESPEWATADFTLAP